MKLYTENDVAEMLQAFVGDMAKPFQSTAKATGAWIADRLAMENERDNVKLSEQAMFACRDTLMANGKESCAHVIGLLANFPNTFPTHTFVITNPFTSKHDEYLVYFEDNDPECLAVHQNGEDAPIMWHVSQLSSMLVQSIDAYMTKYLLTHNS